MKRERMNIAVKRLGSSFIPISRFDQKLILEQPEDAVLEISVARRRSLPQMRKYWAILNEIVENTPAGFSYPTAEHLHYAIKLALGYTTSVVTLDGIIIQVADSIAFDKMDGKQFGEFFERACELLNKLTGTDVLALEAA